MHRAELRLTARAALLALGLVAASAAWGQTVGATFGEVVQLGYTPSDIILDEARQYLYLVNTNASRVDLENRDPQPARFLNPNRTRSSAR